jgi:beta-N-acetylhexosaminidase
VDQEGGRVARFRGAPFTALPPMRVLGQYADEALAERVGRLLAYELRALGIDWDFAPVLDVDTNPANPVIADRALGSDPDKVATLGVALARGLEAGGVASCAKHFPGHGDTQKDSHHTLPVLTHGLERLRSVELVPFRRYAEAGLAAVMTAHVRFAALGDELPATLSRRALTDILRGELGFRGVCVSDDLEMKAVSEQMSLEEATVEGARAGVDVFLVCENADVQRRCLEALVRAVEAGRVSRQRLAEAHRRQEVLLARFAHAPGSQRERLGSAEHQRLAEGLSSQAVAGSDPTEQGRVS